MSAVDHAALAVVSEHAAEALIGGQEPRPRVDQAQLEKQVEQSVQQAVEQAVQGAQGRNPETRARLEEELARARQAVDELQAAQSGGTISITRDGNGNVVIRTQDGKNIVIGEGLVPPAAIEGLVASMAPPPPPPPPMPGDGGPPESVVTLISVIFAALVLMVVGHPIARAIGRRMEARAVPPTVPTDLAVRLERIEQAVDAVAVEVERVSEAQRYSARLLTERLPEHLPQLAAEPLAARPTPDRG